MEVDGRYVTAGCNVQNSDGSKKELPTEKPLISPRQTKPKVCGVDTYSVVCVFFRLAFLYM